MSFSIEVRAATRRDIALAEANASAGESAAWLVDGELVAITDEYGTATLVAGTNATPTQGAVEAFVEAAMAFYCDGLAS